MFSASGGAAAHLMSTICDLVSGMANNLLAQAVNTDDDHGVEAGAAASPSRPGAPTLRRCARGYRCIVLGWDPPSDDGGDSIFGYEMQTSVDGPSGWTSRPGLLPSGRGWLLDSGLPPGTTRHYRLRAVGVAGPGPWSAVLRDTTLRKWAG